MKTALEPLKKRIQVPFLRPNGRNAIPAIQLLLEDFVADLCNVFQRLLIGFPFRQTGISLAPVSGRPVSDVCWLDPLGAARPGMAVPVLQQERIG